MEINLVKIRKTKSQKGPFSWPLRTGKAGYMPVLGRRKVQAVGGDRVLIVTSENWRQNYLNFLKSLDALLCTTLF